MRAGYVPTTFIPRSARLRWLLPKNEVGILLKYESVLVQQDFLKILVLRLIGVKQAISSSSVSRPLKQKKIFLRLRSWFERYKCRSWKEVRLRNDLKLTLELLLQRKRFCVRPSGFCNISWARSTPHFNMLVSQFGPMAGRNRQLSHWTSNNRALRNIQKRQILITRQAIGSPNLRILRNQTRFTWDDDNVTPEKYSLRAVSLDTRCTVPGLALSSNLYYHLQHAHTSAYESSH